MSDPESRSIASRLRNHLIRQLLPLWDQHGWDRKHGGFHSRLTPDLMPVDDGFKRLTVQMRQLYVYSLAAFAPEAPAWARERADRTFEYVLERHWDARHEGWFLTTTPTGAPLDRTKDTYAQSFAVLGLVQYHRIRPESPALALAHQTLDLLDRHARDPIEGGFSEAASETWVPIERVRRHDPHMHLFEASLAGFEETGGERFLETARSLLELFRTRIYPAGSDALPERFSSTWIPLPDSHAEPGHHFEWAWLLERAGQLGIARQTAEIADQLYAFARLYGLDPRDSAVYDRISLSGSPLDRRKRVWPQCEFQKALALRLAPQGENRHGSEDVRPGPEDRSRPSHTDSASRDTESRGLENESVRQTLIASLERSFERYVDPVHGGWHEHADPSGVIVSEAMNATTVYHVYAAFSEVATLLEGGPDHWRSDGEPSR